MRGGSAIGSVLLPAVLTSGVVAAPRPVGQLLDVQGRVEIRHGRQPPAAGGLLSELQAGDTLAVVRGRAEVVLFAKGARFALSTGSTARVDSLGLARLTGPPPRVLPPAPQPLARPLAVAPRPVPLKLLGVVTRGADDSTLGPRQLSPHGAVRQPPVTLRWGGPIEAEQLLVQVSDGDQIVYRISLPPNARSWELPAGVVKPGPWYTWFVTARGSGDESRKGYALLRILTPAERQALAQEESRAARSPSPAAGDPVPVMRRAQVEERLGLFGEARAHYQEVQRLRPDDAAVKAALARLERVAPL